MTAIDRLHLEAPLAGSRTVEELLRAEFLRLGVFDALTIRTTWE
jgi:hypothetical protein